MTQRIPRRAAALLGVLVAIALLTVMLTVVTAQVVAQRKMVQDRHLQLQADWFARAGIEWAADRLLQKPSAFTDDKTDFAADWTVHIAVKKSGAGIFAVTSEASLRDQRGLAMTRSASAHFRRTEKEGHIRLVSIPTETDKD